MKKDVYIYSFIGLVLDIITKIIMIDKIPYRTSKTIIDGFFKLTMVHNTGGAFGLFRDNTIILGIIGVLFTGAFIYYIEKNELSKLERISCSMILSGIIGNIIDRVVRGYVVDFLDFNIFGYDYPVFNVADIFITIGVIALISMLLIYKR